MHGRRAAKLRCPDNEWAEGSLHVMRALENIGLTFEITGLDNIQRLKGPVVFIGNHMSTLETFVLPCIVQPLKPVTFVVKSSLVHIPVFKHLLLSGDPIIVGRRNPREDLTTVLEEGTKKLKSGISIIIFPQSTRSIVFNPEDFNSLGEKLAAKAQVQVIPFALKTDAWGVGKLVRDFGNIDNSKKVHFAFDEPIIIDGRGSKQHDRIIKFIQEQLQDWEMRDSMGNN